MPLPDIDAIRQRLATSYDPYGVNPAIADVATLLTEVDRLTALGNALSDAVVDYRYSTVADAKKAWDDEVGR